MILLTPYYPDADAARRAEFLDCLRRNVANRALDEVHVLLEDDAPPELDAPKLRLVELGRRATFRDLFDYANRALPGRRVVAANADVYFDGGLDRLAACELADTLLCLSRWDVEPDGTASLYEHGESQDAWIFDAPIRSFRAGFRFGLPGCENRLAWEAERAGLRVENPARSLRAYHLHLSGVRRYTEAQRIHGRVRWIPPDFLGPARPEPVACAAFSESMGYRVATLRPGASSHVNDERPFTSIPEPVRELRFTQVVAGSDGPVEVELCTRGKLYVLAGDDWWGYETVRAWLAEHGFHERLPRLETAAGMGFEAWSLVGRAGDRFVVPTQAMLAGRSLVRLEPA